MGRTGRLIVGVVSAFQVRPPLDSALLADDCNFFFNGSRSLCVWFCDPTVEESNTSSNLSVILLPTRNSWDHKSLDRIYVPDDVGAPS